MENLYRPNLGSISHGTLRIQALLKAFADEAERCCNGHLGNLTLVNEARAIEDFDSLKAAEILCDLQDFLDEYSPPYAYFGSHPDDGADFGYWLFKDWQERMEEEGVPEISDLSEMEENYTGELLLINDHGNATFYWVENGKLTEQWSVI